MPAIANKQKLLVISLFLLLPLVSSCAETPGTTEPPGVISAEGILTETEVPSPTDTATALSSPTLTQTPSPTVTLSPSPTLTFPPAPSPTPSPTSVPWSDQTITTENADQLAQLAVWGRGSIQEVVPALDGEILVARSPLGVYIYQAEPFDTIRFIAGAVTFRLSPDETFVATGDPEGIVNLWNLPTGDLLHKLDAGVGPTSPGLFEFMGPEGLDMPAIAAQAFSRDSQRLAVGYRDGIIRIWEVTSGKLVSLLEHSVAPYPGFLAFSPDGEYLVSASRHVGFWQLSDEDLVHRIPNAGGISENPFSPDGDQLVTTQRGGVLLVWKFPFGELEHSYGTGLYSAQAEFSADGEHLIVNGGDQVRRLWDGKQVQPETVLGPSPAEAQETGAFAETGGRDAGHFGGVAGLRLTEDRTVLVWGRPTLGALWWWEVFSGDWHQAVLESLPSGNAAVSQDGQSLFLCTQDGLIKIAAGDQSQETLDRCREQSTLIYGSDNQTLARTSVLLIDLFDPTAETVVTNLRGHTREVRNLGFSPDGELLASNTAAAGGGVELILWALNPPAKLYSLDVPTYGIYTLAFSYNHQLLATGGGDDKVRIWRVEDGWLLRIIRLNSSAFSLAFAPQGDLLAVGQWDGTIQILSVPDGTELTLLSGHSERIVDMVFTPQGDNLITLSGDGTVRLWGVP